MLHLPAFMHFDEISDATNRQLQINDFLFSSMMNTCLYDQIWSQREEYPDVVFCGTCDRRIPSYHAMGVSVECTVGPKDGQVQVGVDCTSEFCVKDSSMCCDLPCPTYDEATCESSSFCHWLGGECRVGDMPCSDATTQQMCFDARDTCWWESDEGRCRVGCSKPLRDYDLRVCKDKVCV